MFFPDSGRPERHIDIRQNNPDVNKLVAEAYSKYEEPVRKDIFRCAQSFITKILSELDMKPIEELAEIAQNFYNLYKNRLNSNLIYEAVPSEVRDELLEYFERYCMVSLYRWVFLNYYDNRFQSKRFKGGFKMVEISVHIVYVFVYACFGKYKNWIAYYFLVIYSAHQLQMMKKKICQFKTEFES